MYLKWRKNFWFGSGLHRHYCNSCRFSKALCHKKETYEQQNWAHEYLVRSKFKMIILIHALYQVWIDSFKIEINISLFISVM